MLGLVASQPELPTALFLPPPFIVVVVVVLFSMSSNFGNQLCWIPISSWLTSSVNRFHKSLQVKSFVSPTLPIIMVMEATSHWQLGAIIYFLLSRRRALSQWMLKSQICNLPSYYHPWPIKNHHWASYLFWCRSYQHTPDGVDKGMSF